MATTKQHEQQSAILPMLRPTTSLPHNAPTAHTSHSRATGLVTERTQVKAAAASNLPPLRPKNIRFPPWSNGDPFTLAIEDAPVSPSQPQPLKARARPKSKWQLAREAEQHTPVRPAPPPTPRATPPEAAPQAALAALSPLLAPATLLHTNNHRGETAVVTTTSPAPLYTLSSNVRAPPSTRATRLALTTADGRKLYTLDARRWAHLVLHSSAPNIETINLVAPTRPRAPPAFVHLEARCVANRAKHHAGQEAQRTLLVIKKTIPAIRYLYFKTVDEKEVLVARESRAGMQLDILVAMAAGERDALVALWCLRVWGDTVEAAARQRGLEREAARMVRERETRGRQVAALV